MTRTDFTYNICQLVIEMFKANETPIIDFVKRSYEEQHRLWLIGRDKDGNKIGNTVTNCDGLHIVSAHQLGKAADILFINGNSVSDPFMGWDFWHKRWTDAYGGKPAIEGDAGHFEG